MSSAISNDRGLLAQQGAARPQTLDLANRHGLQLGDGPEPSFQQQPMQGVNPAAGEAASRPLGAAVAADAMYLQLQPVPPAAAIPAFQPHTSSHDSAGTGHTFAKGTADPKQQQATGYVSGHFVPRKDSNDNIPCFVQTSALFTNMCGYCGTRSTSGCWRRGWEIGPNRFINLCNKCGLRHKAGKLASVPEPPPPQPRGRAAAAAAAASGPFSPQHQLHHSASAADLMNQLLAAAAADDNPGSPNFSSGHAAAASDPTGGTAAHHRQQQQQQGPANSSGRRRRQQKPLTPKWSRVGGLAGAGGGSAGFDSEGQHMFAQMLAAGVFGGGGGGGDSAGDMDGYGGGLLSPQQQHQHQQQQLAMLLQSLGKSPASPSQHDPYSQAAAGHHISSPCQQVPASSSHHTDDHNSNLSLSHYAAVGQQHSSAATAAAAAAASPATMGAGAGSMDSAQAVAAVLAAAAAAAASSDSRGTLPTHSPLKLSKLSVVSVNASALDNSSQISSPAAKKRRTKRDVAGAEGVAADAAPSGGLGSARGQGGEAAMAAQDAAAAGDAADALLALRTSAKPESPSWARLQHLATGTTGPGAFGSLPMPGPNSNLDINRQVTSPSVDTTGCAKPGRLSHQYNSPTLLQTANSPTAHTLAQALPQQAHPGPSALRPHSSHLQPLQAQRLPAHQMAPQAAHAPNWSPEQIQAWLVQVDCGEVAAAFQAQGVDGQALSGLMRVVSDAGAARLDSQLKTEFGVEGVGVRLRLVDRLMRELAGLAGLYGGQL